MGVGSSSRKGISFTIIEVMGVFAFVIFAVMVMAILMSGGSGIAGFLACDEDAPSWYWWCDQKELSQDNIIAYQSTASLACALSAVAQGNDALPCIKTAPQYEEKENQVFPPLSPAGKIGEIGDAIKQSELGLTCEKKPGGEGQVTCLLKGFHLPERFSPELFKDDFNEYIGGFGDPTYLIFQTIFPLGEDYSWNGFWVSYSGIVRVGTYAVPAGLLGVKARKLVTSPLKYLTKTKLGKFAIVGGVIAAVVYFKDVFDQVETGKDTGGTMILTDTSTTPGEARKIVYNVAKNKINKVIKNTYGNSVDTYLKVTEKGINQEEVTSAFILAEEENPDQSLLNGVPDLFQFLKQDEKDRITDAVVLEGEESIKTVQNYFDVSIATIIAEQAACQHSKALNRPNTLVLQKALQCDDSGIKTVPLSGLETTALNNLAPNNEKPVILKKRATDDDTQFYLASPCRADLFVYEDNVVCDKYVVTQEGSVICENPELSSTNELQCGDIEKNLELLSSETPSLKSTIDMSDLEALFGLSYRPLFTYETSNEFVQTEITKAVGDTLSKKEYEEIVESLLGSSLLKITFPYLGDTSTGIPLNDVWIDHITKINEGTSNYFPGLEQKIYHFYEGRIQSTEPKPAILRSVTSGNFVYETDMFLEEDVPYVLHIYAVDDNWGSNDMAIDVYRVDEICKNGLDIVVYDYSENLKKATCNEILSNHATIFIDEIPEIITTFHENDNFEGDFYRFVPQETIPFNSLGWNTGIFKTTGSVSNCGDSNMENYLCLRLAEQPRIRFNCGFFTSRKQEPFVCEMQDADLPLLSDFFAPATDVKVLKFEGNIYSRLFAQVIQFDSSRLLTFKDIDGDGEWENIELQGYTIPGEGAQVLSMDDYDADGKIDTLMQEECTTRGIVVSPDMSNYKDEHNFCYSKTSWWIVIGKPIVNILDGVALGAAPSSGGLSLALSGVSLGLDYVVEKLGDSNWPG
ncbi:MAG: hypothetical protein KKA90_02035 [Nanoarchaeota archaeon]|nr:hypothetical protein [Nanoarchaeota archaeon]